MFCYPEHCKIVRALEPQAGGAVTGDYVSLKNVHMAWVQVHITQAQANTVKININKATAVLPSDATAITVAVPIWSNLDCAASDLLVRRTDAVNYTTDAGVKHKIIIFQIDPASLGALAGTGPYDCIAVETEASHADNLTEAHYVLQERYAADQPPSAIID